MRSNLGANPDSEDINKILKSYHHQNGLRNYQTSHGEWYLKIFSKMGYADLVIFTVQKILGKSFKTRTIRNIYTGCFLDTKICPLIVHFRGFPK